MVIGEWPARLLSHRLKVKATFFFLKKSSCFKKIDQSLSSDYITGKVEKLNKAIDRD